MQENITVSGKRGGSLDGNSTRKLLSVIDSLANYLSQHSEESFRLAEPFLRTLRALNTVVGSAFGNKLKDNWEKSIVDLSVHYLSLKTKNDKSVTVTPKVTALFSYFLYDQLFCFYQVHMLIRHVPEFLKNNSEGSKVNYFHKKSSIFTCVISIQALAFGQNRHLNLFMQILK